MDVQDHTEELKQRVVKLEAMAARNSSDKVISAQVSQLTCMSLLGYLDQQSVSQQDLDYHTHKYSSMLQKIVISG